MYCSLAAGPRARSHPSAPQMLTLLKLAAQLTEKRSLKYSYSTLLCNVSHYTSPACPFEAVHLCRLVVQDVQSHVISRVSV